MTSVLSLFRQDLFRQEYMCFSVSSHTVSCPVFEADLVVTSSAAAGYATRSCSRAWSAAWRGQLAASPDQTLPYLRPRWQRHGVGGRKWLLT